MRGADDGLASAGRIFTLHPGDVALGQRGDQLTTLLGSCVAVIMTDPRRTVGTMCHIVHTSECIPAGTARDSAWGDVALYDMYQLLRDAGIEPRLCEAYVYGGGNMFPALFSTTHVGASNASWVLRELEADGVRIVHQDLGGASYRRLRWTVGLDAPVVEAVPV